jgi:hypothetical protein
MRQLVNFLLLATYFIKFVVLEFYVSFFAVNHPFKSTEESLELLVLQVIQYW